MCTSFRESRNAKQGGEWQRNASVQTDGLLFLKYKQMLVKAFTEQILPHFSTEGPQRLLPVLDRVYPVAEIQEAHEYMETNKNVGKIVLELPQWRSG